MKVALRFPVTSLVRVLAALAGVLVVVHLALQIWHYRVHDVIWVVRDLFDLDEENNIPAWYGAALMLLASLLLGMIAGARRREHTPDANHWLGLAVGFIVLSIGKDASLTDAFQTAVRKWSGYEDFSWTMPAAVLVVILGIAYRGFLSRLMPPTRRRFVVAGASYVAGSLGMEWVARGYLGASRAHTPDSLPYNLISAGKQTLEMFGLVLFIHALLVLMSGTVGDPSAVPMVLEIEP